MAAPGSIAATAAARLTERGNPASRSALPAQRHLRNGSGQDSPKAPKPANQKALARMRAAHITAVFPDVALASLGRGAAHPLGRNRLAFCDRFAEQEQDGSDDRHTDQHADPPWIEVG